MRFFKYFVFVLFTMLVSFNVNALEVNDFAELKTCLAGEAATCTVKEAITLNGTSNETLDLNGKTIVLEKFITVDGNATLTVQGNGTVESSVKTCLFFIKNGGTLVIKNGIFNVTTPGGMVFYIVGTVTDSGVKTTLTIEDGVKLSANYGITVGHAGDEASYGVVVNYAGDFQGITGNDTYKDGSIGITTNGFIKKNSGNIPVINITGGEIKTVEGTTTDINDDDAPAIYAAGYAKWNISDGTIEGSEALSIKAGEFDVTGGELKAFGTYSDPALPENSGSEATGAAISITANDSYAKAVKITVKDAVVESEKGHAVYEGKSASQTTALVDGGIKLEGGIYNSEKEALMVNNAEGFVTGGTYSSEVDEDYLSTDLVTKEDENGNYLVGEEHTITVNNVTNETVVADKQKAVAGETVTLTITPNKDYLTKFVEVIVTGTNSKVNVSNGKFVMPDGDVEVNVTFEAVPNPDTSDNVVIYLVLGMISLVFLTASVIKMKKFN